MSLLDGRPDCRFGLTAMAAASLLSAVCFTVGARPSFRLAPAGRAATPRALAFARHDATSLQYCPHTLQFFDPPLKTLILLGFYNTEIGISWVAAMAVAAKQSGRPEFKFEAPAVRLVASYLRIILRS